MGMIIRAYYTGDAEPQNRIHIDGDHLKADAGVDDVRLQRSILDDQPPFAVLISTSEICEISVLPDFDSSKQGAAVQMKDSAGTWTAWVEVAKA